MLKEKIKERSAKAQMNVEIFQSMLTALYGVKFVEVKGFLETTPKKGKKK